MIDVAKTLTVRERLKAKLDKVPRSVAGMGIQATLNYKTWLAGARKASTNPRTSEQQIGALLAHYDSLDREVLL